MRVAKRLFACISICAAATIPLAVGNSGDSGGAPKDERSLPAARSPLFSSSDTASDISKFADAVGVGSSHFSSYSHSPSSRGATDNGDPRATQGLFGSALQSLAVPQQSFGQSVWPEKDSLQSKEWRDAYAANGWIEGIYQYVNAPYAFTYIGTTIQVPNYYPFTYGAQHQTLHWWTGFVNQDYPTGNEIIQAVLTYGPSRVCPDVPQSNDCAKYYIWVYYANDSVVPSQVTYTGGPYLGMEVYPGETISFKVAAWDCNASGACRYDVTASVPSRNISTGLSRIQVAQPMRWAYANVLESAFVFYCTEYPPAGYFYGPIFPAQMATTSNGLKWKNTFPSYEGEFSAFNPAYPAWYARTYYTSGDSCYFSASGSSGGTYAGTLQFW